MNEKAAEYGLPDTQFVAVVAHDTSGHYSTAKDLYRLSRIALANKTIAGIVAKKSYVARAESGKTYYLSNTNQLLANSRYSGVKTGTTYSAGECLISLYNDGQKKIIGVVLGSNSRFYETESIIEWTRKAFKW